MNGSRANGARGRTPTTSDSHGSADRCAAMWRHYWLGTVGHPPNPRRWAWRCHKRRSWEVGWMPPNWVQQQRTATRKPIWVPRQQHPHEDGGVVMYAQGPNGSHQSRLLWVFPMALVLMQNKSINTAIEITKKTELRLCRLVFKTITTNQNTRVPPLAGQFD